MLCEEAVRKKDLREEENTPRRVCFVCTGNTCRSPMAAAVANHLSRLSLEALPESVRDCATPPIEAFSAGLYAVEGEPISSHAVSALEEVGVIPTDTADYRKHTAHTLTDALAESCDLLVGMSGGHVMELILRYPHLAYKIVCMPTPISDPFGGDADRYKACLREITQGVRALLFEECEA